MSSSSDSSSGRSSPQRPSQPVRRLLGHLAFPAQESRATDDAQSHAAAPASRWFWLASFAGGLLLTVLIMKGRLYAASTDLAQHYDLAQYLATHWTWPQGASLASGMQTYPPLAHYLGAAAGLAFHSTLVGVNAVAAAATFLCYLLLARTLSVGSPVSAAVAVALVVAGLWLARAHHAAEGFEVYNNYFYAQLVGEAVFLIAALWLATEERPWLVQWVAAAALTFACGWLYAITALEIALAYLALEGMLLLRRISAERTFQVGWALPLLVGAVTLPLLVYFHPYFHLMVMVSNHDGGLELPGVQELVPELAAILLVVGLLLGLTRPKAERWRRPLLFLAVACCATAAAALAQEIVFEVAKIGSPYAVKKYAFSTVTLLVFGLCALAGSWLDSRRQPRPWPALAIGLPPLFALIAVVVMPPTKPERLGGFVAYQRSVKALLANPRTPRDAFGNTASLNQEFSPFLNLALTMGDLGLDQSRSLAAFGMSSSKPSETYALLNVSANEVPDRCAAKVSGLSTIALVSLNCGPLSGGERQFSEDLSKLSFLPQHFVSGWSVKEPGGVWSDGPKAQIDLHFDRPTGPLLMTIEGNAFIPTAGYVQHIQVSAGGARLAEWSFDGANPSGSRQVVIPARLIVDGDLKLDFAFPDAVRPTVPGNPPGLRQLGFFVRDVSIESMRELQLGDRVDLSKLVLSPSFLTDGWSNKEPTGVWSRGRKSSMVVPIAKGDWDPAVVLEGNGFFPTPDYRQRVVVRVGRTVVAQWTMDAKTPAQAHPIIVPRRLASGGEITLDFDFPDATSPAAHRMSGDTRDLAFFVTAVGVRDGGHGAVAAGATGGAAVKERAPS
jgi:hypothetical protein